MRQDSHSVTMGYILWLFGFMGAHRFYYGRKISGAIWFATFGLLGIGWIIDLFLIPGMDAKADVKFQPGRLSYNVGWILLTFFGLLGVHRFYLGKWVSGLIYLLTGGLFTIGWLYDFWNFNELTDEANRQPA